MTQNGKLGVAMSIADMRLVPVARRLTCTALEIQNKWMVLTGENNMVLTRRQLSGP